ncbi:type VI secretion protein [Brevundimonas sp.]|uniref:type VI secretion protein n=1 Tax=Brevundimonas sp. TaxID=1871086 RepID=UPI0039E40E53
MIVKALVCRHQGRGAAHASALARHVAYLSRLGAGWEGETAAFFDAGSDRVDAQARLQEWAKHRHHFRFIVSPEHGDRLKNLPDYVRETMRRVCGDLGEPDLPWMAVCHYDTDQPHGHVLLPGRRADGRDLVIPRAYIGYGFRARAQEVAQERLGDLSRQDAERRIWRETQADRLTGFDRRLLASADTERMVSDGVGGTDVWQALTRGRLRHLEKLGLATRIGRRFRLAEDMESRLRRLQLARDVIRLRNQRRLQTGRAVLDAREGVLRGRVVKTGFHDELGACPWAIVAESGGVERYVRLRPGAPMPEPGRAIEMVVGSGGVGRPMPPRSRGRGLSL